MKTSVRNVSVVAMLIFLFTSIYGMQQKLTTEKNSSWFKERMSYLPQTEKIKPYLLGFTVPYADYLWIRTMLYFGSHYESDKDFTWLVTMIDMVTKLNPYFYPAYEFAGVMIPGFSDNLDAARVILNRGITHLGNKHYSIPFYLAWIYYDKYDNPEEAAYYLSLAARNPKAPPFYSALAATMFTDAGKKEQAMAFLYSAYESSENPTVKATVKNKIIALGGKVE